MQCDRRGFLSIMLQVGLALEARAWGYSGSELCSRTAMKHKIYISRSRLNCSINAKGLGQATECNECPDRAIRYIYDYTLKFIEYTYCGTELIQCYYEH